MLPTGVANRWKMAECIEQAIDLIAEGGMETRNLAAAEWTEGAERLIRAFDDHRNESVRWQADARS